MGRTRITLLAAGIAGVAVASFLIARSDAANDGAGVLDASDAVYLDEPAPVPPPTVVTSGKLSDKYQDGSVSVEREVQKLSDDQIINHGSYTEFYRNGQKFSEGVYNRGVHDGQWTFWHENGQLAKTVTFVNGLADGAWDVFRPDGTLQARKSYKLNQRDGAWKHFYEDGKTPKIEETYADGRLSGPRTTYFPNGRPRQTATFAAGVLDGPLTEWDESGRKVLEATFVAGRLNGNLFRWGADGTEQERSYWGNADGMGGFREQPLPPPEPTEGLHFSNSRE